MVKRALDNGEALSVCSVLSGSFQIASENGVHKAAKLWNPTGSSLHPLVEAYTVGEDYIIDQKHMLPFDLEASEAHAIMLRSIGVLTDEDLETLQRALREIAGLWKKGEFKVTQDQEDCHTAIEQYITEHFGEVGKKIHTGRSRNDQTLAMLRLFSRSKLDEAIQVVETLSALFAERGKAFEGVPMPGYTHMQKAMPASVQMWLGSYADGFEDALHVLRGTKPVVNQNPLGSAAGFGVKHLALDRAKTSELLQFARTQENPMYCGMSRGMFENVVLQAMTLPMVLSSRFATDMMTFTQQEFQFFELPSSFVTGSSIMPQKKNYDLFEIMRGNGKVFSSLQMQVQQVVMGLGSGYHRDLQITKKAFVEAVELCLDTLILIKECLPHLVVKKKTLEDAMTPELFVTDEVYKRVSKGESFRDAYLAVKTEFFQEKGF